MTTWILVLVPKPTSKHMPAVIGGYATRDAALEAGALAVGLSAKKMDEELYGSDSGTWRDIGGIYSDYGFAVSSAWFGFTVLPGAI